MNTPEQKLSEWLRNNPEGYYTLPMEQIAKDAGVGLGAANRILPVLIAKRDGVLPSVVKERRFITTQRRIDRNRLWELYKQGVTATDIAFILGCSEGSVRDIIRRESPPDESSKDIGRILR